MAEVKVKVTAQNEVRTGLQQALQETKKFGEEAKKAVSQPLTINPFKDDDGLGPLRDIQRQARELRELARAPIEPLGGGGAAAGGLTASESRRASTAIRGLASDLATASTPAQAFEAVLTRLAQAAGRLTSVVVGFAVGKIVSSQFDKLNAGFEQAISNANNFQRALTDSGKASDFSGAINSFRQLNALAAQTGETLSRLQKDLGASAANFALGGVPFRELAALEESQRRAAGANLVQNTAFLAQQAGGRLAVAGDSSAEQEFERKAKQQQELFALEQQLNAARARGDAQLTLDLKNAIAFTKERFDIEDQIVQKRREAAKEAEALAARQQAAGTSRAIADFGANPETLLARARERLSVLENPNIAANIGLTPEQAAAERKRIMLEILGLEQQITNEAEQQAKQREGAAKTLEDVLEAREFTGMSPAEQRAKIEADQAALVAGLESGAISPAEAAQRALELQRRQDALAGGAAGFSGASGASALQRVGFASNEFFSSGGKKDASEETRRAAEFVKQILDIMRRGDPLVLPSA